MDLQKLRNRLTLAGFDLADDEARDLLNEGIRDLASRSQFPRKVWETETVIDQTAYPWPSDLIVPISVRLNGHELEAADALTIAAQDAGDLVNWAYGSWYADEDESTLNLHPVPSEVLPLKVQYVYMPTALVLNSDEPIAFPEEFHPALIDYVGSVYYSTVEDDEETAQVKEQRFQTRAADLGRLGIMREEGGGPFQIQIAGMTR